MNEYLEKLKAIWRKLEDMAYADPVPTTKLVKKELPTPPPKSEKPKTKYQIALDNMKKVQQERNKNNIAIPYIPEKGVKLTNAGKLTGAEFSTNMLDSIAKYGSRAKLPIQQALGLAAQESTFGNAKTNGYQSQKDRGVIYGSSVISNWAHGRENPWRDLIITSERKAGAKRPGKPDADYSNVNDSILEKSITDGWRYTENQMKKFNTDINVLEHGFNLFKEGKYNPGDPNHTRDVINAGKLAWNSPEIQKWWNDSGKKYYKQGGRLIPKKDIGGELGSIAAGMIPVYGTYQDIKTAYNNPTLENIGWAVASGVGDALFFTGAGAGIKSLKLLNQTRKARKLLESKRRLTALTAQNKFKNTVMDRVLDKATPTDIIRARESAKATLANYRNAVSKFNNANTQVNSQVKQLGKKSVSDLKRDGTVQTVQEISKFKDK